ncbi:MAG TPA: dienelactone hydrolase family protein [Chloroflexota bacterium]|jgi:carboxymethylenebutenolidase
MSLETARGETIEFRAGADTIRAHLARPAGTGRAPAVILLHGINGLAAGNREAADQFAAAGYVALAMDGFSVDKDPHDRVVMGYVDAAGDYLRAQDYVDAERLVVGGYCRGGAQTYVALAEHPWLRAGLAYHATLPRQPDPARRAEVFEYADRIKAPVLILHGAADHTSPIENTYRLVRQFDAQGTPYALKVYSGVGHGFYLPEGSGYDAYASADSWRETLAFLEHHLGG